MNERPKKSDSESIHFQVLYWGLLLNVFVPAILVILGLYLRSKGIGVSPIKGLDFLLIILLLVSVTEVLFIFFFRKGFFFKEKTGGSAGTEDDLKRYSLILFSLCLTPTVYGFVYYLLGGTLEWFIIFACITLICFRFFKPGLGQMKEFLRMEDPGSE